MDSAMLKPGLDHCAVNHAVRGTPARRRETFQDANNPATFAYENYFSLNPTHPPHHSSSYPLFSESSALRMLPADRAGNTAAAPSAPLSSTFSEPISREQCLPTDVGLICPQGDNILPDSSTSLHPPAESENPGTSRDGPAMPLSSVMAEWVFGARRLEEENMRLHNELQQQMNIISALRNHEKHTQETAVRVAEEHAEVLAHNNTTQTRLWNERQMHWAESNRLRNECDVLGSQATALRTALADRTAELASCGSELTVMKRLNVDLASHVRYLTEMIDARGHGGERQELETCLAAASSDSPIQVKEESDSTVRLYEQVELRCQPKPNLTIAPIGPNTKLSLRVGMLPSDFDTGKPKAKRRRSWEKYETDAGGDHPISEARAGVRPRFEDDPSSDAGFRISYASFQVDV
ncbi:hypothetical protein R3P38DRAFT_3375130 [Favolaschia claudopus]|uniref:Uncharacterized protein n=1 Tax=Favolaschia claudopus TaxID=2862362 RepID=A0AAV9ZIX9_9AGAR